MTCSLNVWLSPLFVVPIPTPYSEEAKHDAPAPTIRDDLPRSDDELAAPIAIPALSKT